MTDSVVGGAGCPPSRSRWREPWVYLYGGTEGRESLARRGGWSGMPAFAVSLARARLRRGKFRFPPVAENGIWRERVGIEPDPGPLRAPHWF